MYTVTVIPFVVSFNYTDSVITLFDTFVDFLFMCDIVLTFFATYIDSNGKLITNAKQMRMTYLKGWFIWDFIAAMPYSLISFVKTESVSTLFNNFFQLRNLLGDKCHS